MGYCKDCFYCHKNEEDRGDGFFASLMGPKITYRCSLRGNVTEYGSCSDYEPRYTPGDYKPGYRR